MDWYATMALVFIEVPLVFTDVSPSMNTNKPFRANGLRIDIHRCLVFIE
jgi:hypothetical protein